MLHIYNTATRSKQAFRPLSPGKVRMYVCGMTVYDYCHIGHGRVLVAFDVVVRCLRMLGYEVEYARNITDVDDKILARALENNENHKDLSQRFIRAMEEDCRALGVMGATHEPRATEHMEEIITMIEILINGGYAYTTSNGDVYYAIERFANYGNLSHQKVDELIAGARVAPGADKKHPADFALWKSAPADTVGWKAPWSWGRPGWHIECSAMSKACLGDTLDIHGGGPDLVFPHHENEIAQSEAANGCSLAKTWMHIGAVRTHDGEEMSKSKDNFVRLRDALHMCHPEVLRYYLMSAHYRSTLEYDIAALHESASALERLYRAVRNCPRTNVVLDRNEPYTQRFVRCVEDDFNIPEALAVLFDLARTLNSSEDALERTRLSCVLYSLTDILGLVQDNPEDFLHSGAVKTSSSLNDDAIGDLITQRSVARKERDYARADEIRKNLEREGVFLEDRDDVTIWHRRGAG